MFSKINHSDVTLFDFVLYFVEWLFSLRMENTLNEAIILFAFRFAFANNDYDVILITMTSFRWRRHQYKILKIKGAVTMATIVKHAYMPTRDTCYLNLTIKIRTVLLN